MSDVPAMGRIVIYVNGAGREKPAIITEVHSAISVNLIVFSAPSTEVQRVPLQGSVSPTPLGYWYWPTF